MAVFFFDLLNVGNEVVELVANAGIAQVQVLRHFLEAATALYKLYDEVLIVFTEANEQGQRKNAFHTGVAARAFEASNLQLPAA
jgi:hypothetical protein